MLHGGGALFERGLLVGGQVVGKDLFAAALSDDGGNADAEVFLAIFAFKIASSRRAGWI